MANSFSVCLTTPTFFLYGAPPTKVIAFIQFVVAQGHKGEETKGTREPIERCPGGHCLLQRQLKDQMPGNRFRRQSAQATQIWTRIVVRSLSVLRQPNVACFLLGPIARPFAISFQSFLFFRVRENNLEEEKAGVSTLKAQAFLSAPLRSRLMQTPGLLSFCLFVSFFLFSFFPVALSHFSPLARYSSPISLHHFHMGDSYCRDSEGWVSFLSPSPSLSLSLSLRSPVVPSIHNNLHRLTVSLCPTFFHILP